VAAPGRIVVAWLPAAVYMAAIWTLSSMHLTDFPVGAFPLADKGVHFVEYMALGFLVAHAALRTWPAHSAARTLTLAVVITVAWGLLDEMHQAFVPGRAADAFDLLADLLGAVAGACFRFVLRVLAARRRAS